MPKQLLLDPRIRRLLKIGLEHHRAGRTGPAEGFYHRILHADPRCSQALHMLGVLALQAGQFQKSIQLMGEALALDPDNPDVLCNLAECYLRQCRFEPASQCYRRLAELLPQSAEALHRLGVTQEQMHDWEAAAESYRRALAVQPDSPDLHGSLGRLQCKQGAFAEGVESYRRALALDANRHDIYNQMGNALAALGKFEAAAEAFRRALALQPHSAETAYGLGYLFERQGDWIPRKIPTGRPWSSIPGWGLPTCIWELRILYGATGGRPLSVPKCCGKWIRTPPKPTAFLPSCISSKAISLSAGANMRPAGAPRTAFAIAGSFANPSGKVNPSKVREFCCTPSKGWVTLSNSFAMSPWSQREEGKLSWKSSPACSACWRGPQERRRSFLGMRRSPSSPGSAR